LIGRAGCTNLRFTMPAMSIIDKAARRTLLLIGFIAFFGFSQGAVIWVYTREVFPTAVRAKGQSPGSFTRRAMNAAIAWTFPVIAASSKPAPFVVFAGNIPLEEMKKKPGIVSGAAS
jgi:hypothetical protein